ncbi:Branchpoint-bridging protein [Intoshia linei]|uniref:Branchpoint-bridging protein n=1 Tax=Intoshia linei TaxID=1819745 RepID=A0A177BCB0_9BILA|nr:Branchpoint-bridging protein [Intoshia linei]
MAPSRDKYEYRRRSPESVRERRRSREYSREKRRNRDRDRDYRDRSRRSRDKKIDRDSRKREKTPDNVNVNNTALVEVQPEIVVEKVKPDKSKAKKSRFSDTSERSIIPGVPTIVSNKMSKTQEKLYLLQLEVEDINQRLRIGNFNVTDTDNRSPSPEPIYSHDGKRLNTKDIRFREKLEEKRNEIIDKIIKLNPLYRPPMEYKISTMNRVIDKVFIPQDLHPSINFVGLIIGPRGNTLKMLEKETGCKIIIRGKGSIKEGKIARPNGVPLPGEDEPLHAYITAATADLVLKAVKRIKGIVKDGIEVPQCNNDLRKQQLRELALLNGTLRETEGISRLKQLEEAQNIVTNQIFCTKCGGAGHLSSDCLVVNTEDAKNPVEKAQMDSEYMSLMAELGQSVDRKTVAFNSVGAGASIGIGISNYCLPAPNGHSFNSLDNQMYPNMYVPVPNTPLFNIQTPVQPQIFCYPGNNNNNFAPPPPPNEDIKPPPPPC